MDIEKLNRALKALADVNRLRMLGLLKESDLCVCQIMGVLGLSQPLVSRHLGILKTAGFLDSYRDGKLVYYRFAPVEAVFDRLAVAVCREICDDRIIAEDRERLRECTELQKETGRCDVELFHEYARRKSR